MSMATLPADGAAATLDPAPLTIGVEEEFLLLDPRTGANLPVADRVLAALPAAARGQSRQELRRSMLEMATPVCTGLPALRRSLAGLRRAAAEAAASAGAHLVAVGATPVGEPDPRVPQEPRYRAIAERYGPVALDPAVCGVHVHVGVPDRELAVRVCNHVQGWLPVIRALAANSPFYRGRDTGHSSWRAMQLQRWPGLGPTPRFGSADEYDRAVGELVASGALLDEGMVYWYARLSPRYPTVEIRVGDVGMTLDDTLLTAALTRALVATAIAEVRAGVPAPLPREPLVAAAHWRAGHHGVADALVDPRDGRMRPAWSVVDGLFAWVSPALDRAGDIDSTRDALDRIRREGDGAARQRRRYGRDGDLVALLGYLAEQTVAG